LWALSNLDGWANWSDDENESIFPVWSEEKDAQLCAGTTFHDYRPTELSLSEFVAEFIPELAAENMFIGINLSDEMTGIDLSCDEFERVVQH